MKEVKNKTPTKKKGKEEDKKSESSEEEKDEEEEEEEEVEVKKSTAKSPVRKTKTMADVVASAASITKDVKGKTRGKGNKKK